MGRRQVVGDVAQLERSSSPSDARRNAKRAQPVAMHSANTAARQHGAATDATGRCRRGPSRTLIDRIVELRHSGESYRPIAVRLLDAERLSPQRACHCGNGSADRRIARRQARRV